MSSVEAILKNFDEQALMLVGVICVCVEGGGSLKLLVSTNRSRKHNVVYCFCKTENDEIFVTATDLKSIKHTNKRQNALFGQDRTCHDQSGMCKLVNGADYVLATKGKRYPH